MTSIKWIRLPVGIAVAMVLLVSVSFAQQGAKAQAGRAYDPMNVETITGEVIGVEKIPSPGGKGYGVHLSVKTKKETIAVEVGPGWYVEKQPVKIEVKDILEIRGSSSCGTRTVSLRGVVVVVVRRIESTHQGKGGTG